MCVRVCVCACVCLCVCVWCVCFKCVSLCVCMFSVLYMRLMCNVLLVNCVWKLGCLGTKRLVNVS